MAKIAPFRAVRYNNQKINDFAKVVCPPYDVISPNRQQFYHNLDKNNLIHILLGKDVPFQNKYKRAGALFKEWLKHEILIQDEKPAIYFYSQQYNLKGETKTRLGFIALLSLEEKKSGVYGHENTRSEAKEDRYRLLKQVKANLSPIFAIFADKKRIVQRTYEQFMENTLALIELVDDEKCVHRIWRIDSPEILEKFQKEMQDENVFIADGHHRYEVACVYRQEMLKKKKKKAGNKPKAARKKEGYDYILTYFTNIESRGLMVLPIHRLVKIGTQISMQALISKLSEYFDVIEEIADKSKFFYLMEKAGASEHVLGMYRRRKFYLLRLRNSKFVDNMMTDKSMVYRQLDVSILNYAVIKGVLGLDLEDKKNITFDNDAENLINKVDSDDSLIAFFLNPVRVQQIMSVALEGEKMPPKSTYFYPKVLSGLVINKF